MTGNDTYTYPPGTIILLESGECSDFSYCGQLVTLQELDLRAAIAEFLAPHANKAEWDKPSHDEFVGWLCATQRCAALECQTAHIGSYGRLELDDQ